MPLTLDHVTLPPLRDISAEAPAGVVIGLLSDDVGAQRALLRVAAGLDRPQAGQVLSSGPSRIVGPFDPLDLSPAPNLMLDHALAFYGQAARAQALFALEGLRQSGSTILIASQELGLLETLSDELWWIDNGALVERGDPQEVLKLYRGHIAQITRSWGENQPQALRPRFHRGDGRARLLAVEPLNAQGTPSLVWTSGEPVVLRVTVQFQAPVEDPVVGILLRTRTGMEVYGTNTELERIKLGPVAAGQTLAVHFQFNCQLCPRDYSITAASHDPDGVWHEWLEDAVGVTVVGSRYTAGVADLRARIGVEKK